MVGQMGQKVTKYGQPYQSEGTQRVQNGEEGKFGKSQRLKKKWTTVDTTIHSKLQNPVFFYYADSFFEKCSLTVVALYQWESRDSSTTRIFF